MIVDGIKGIYKFNSQLTPRWEKTVGTVKNVKFVNDVELKVEYNFEWQNKTFSHSYSEKGKPDTGLRAQLNFNYEKIKNARKISIWVNANNPSESSIFPMRNNELAKFVYQIKFGVAMLILPGFFIFLIWFFSTIEKRVLENIKILELK